jgi:hypothetical protein
MLGNGGGVPPIMAPWPVKDVSASLLFAPLTSTAWFLLMASFLDRLRFHTWACHGGRVPGVVSLARRFSILFVQSF